MNTFQLNKVSFRYPGQEKTALKDLTLLIGQGEFVTICGTSGCGKTTLLRQLKTTLAPHGELQGEILFEGQNLIQVSQRTQASKIGFVFQNPENQIVTDKVWHELAFGLESLGFSTSEIRLRVAEMASFFGIQNWFYKDVTELSGGQKQLLNLAAVMTLQPSVLILDESTAQLDPIAASDFFAALAKVNRELGVTVILTEHRLEEAFPLSDRVIVLENGQLCCDGSPKEVGLALAGRSHSMFYAMPTPMRVFAAVPSSLACPITIREGRDWLDKLTQNRKSFQPHTERGTVMNKFAASIGDRRKVPEKEALFNEAAVDLKEVWFQYEKNGPDVIKGLSLSVCKGEFLAILGGNGTGKTTALSLISGINKAYRGKVSINGTWAALPQNPQSLFVKKTVEEDLREMLKDKKFTSEDKQNRINRVTELCNLQELLRRHPYDLSGGEQQRAALAKVLLLESEILLLDEPTKGLDAEFKLSFAAILKRLREQGVTVIMVSHDLEFCAEHAQRCALFFDGDIVSDGPPRRFFSENSFYTTAANRMARHLIKHAVTAEDIITALDDAVPEETEYYITAMAENEGENQDPVEGIYESPVLMRDIGEKSELTTGLQVQAGKLEKLRDPQAGSNMEVSGELRQKDNVEGAGSDEGSAQTRKTHRVEQIAAEDRKLSGRTKAAALMILAVIPLTIFTGIYYLDDRKYYFISTLILLESLLPFLMIFEKRKPQARELVVIAVLCGIAVAGRAAFFWVPQFKPVTAIVMISAVAFGGEAGFLVGAMTALASNMFFGQGPWTPWQMFAFGVIGFLTGVLFRKGLLRSNKYALAIFGGLSAFIIYGGIMNPASVLMFQNHPVKEMFFLAYLQGIPFDLIHAAATVFFLLTVSEPMLEKLERIKLKYGLIMDSKHSEKTEIRASAGADAGAGVSASAGTDVPVNGAAASTDAVRNGKSEYER